MLRINDEINQDFCWFSILMAMTKSSIDRGRSNVYKIENIFERIIFILDEISLSMNYLNIYPK